MNKEQQHTRVATLLRVCTLLLAAVSFWSTAQGMKEYTFPKGWQAYMASLGIQGLLLGLNFSFFRFWRLSKTRALRTVLLLLTFVVLICSSWFSFLYIAQKAYSQSWTTEGRLLAQKTYRNELFEADTYLKQYGDEMEQTLANQISDLYDRAAEMDSGKVNVTGNLNWDSEEASFSESAARDTMITIIDAMEQATAEGASQDARQQSAKIVDTLRESLQGTINRLNTQISEADERVEQNRANLQAANQRLTNAASGVDRTTLLRAAEIAARTLETSLTRQSELEAQRQDYQTAYDRATYYSTLLGMTNEGVSGFYVGAKLREIQKELFGADPDSGKMLTSATDVFERLQSAVDLEQENNYQRLLSDMNRFVRNISNYDTIKTRDSELQTFIDALAKGSLLALSEPKSNTDEEPNSWMKDWQNTFNELKSTISGLPVYTGTAGSEALRSYNREDATARLDQAIRNYLTEHNTAQQGLIYLASPYRSIAIFSLILALLLDVAAFVTGFVIDRADVSANQNTPVTGVFARNRTGTAQAQAEEVDQDLGQALEWNARPPLNRYTFLTGDFQYLDGVRTYKAVENGAETELEYEGELPAGFYCWNGNKMTPLAPAELCYHGEGDGSRDGVYEKAILQYEEQLLYIRQGESKKHIGTVDPLVPLYLISKDGFDLQSVTTPPNAEAAHIVISLNKTGTRIIAVYVVN